ncbi:MAG: hypothetical protein Q7S57_00100 [bacterium]|nr:hypothetical protein [bacterium]
MSEQLTMENLEKVLDKKFAENNEVLIEAIDAKFQRTDAKIEKLDARVSMLEVDVAGLKYDFAETKSETRERLRRIEESLDKLTNTLDMFLKRMLDQEDEFVIMKAEVAQIKNILKEKLGIEVRV